jgi:lipopolysaccharide export system permease protein
LSLTILKYIPQLLTVSVFTGVLLAIGRSFHEREMDVWFASGIGLRHFVLPEILFALPIVLAIAGASLYLSPWSVRTADALRAQLVSDVNPENIRAGEFGTTPGNIFTYFFNGDREDAGNIFIARNDGNFHEIIIAAKARRDTANDVELLALEHGVLYRLPRLADTGVAEATGFERMLINLPATQIASDSPRGATTKSLNWRDATERAEIIWRIHQPLAALFLVLLAPFIARSHPQLGRGIGFLIALLLFCIYLNLLYFVRGGVAGKDMSTIIALLLPPLAVFAVAWLIERPLRR